MLRSRHENHVAARQRHVRGHPCAFGSERIFGDLNENFFAARDLLFERQTARRLRPRRRLGKLDLVPRGQQLRVFGLTGKVRRVKKPGFFHADFDEGSLHAGQHPRHFAFVNISGDAHLFFSFDQKLGQQTVLDEGDAAFLRRRTYVNLLLHRIAKLGLKTAGVCEKEPRGGAVSSLETRHELAVFIVEFMIHFKQGRRAGLPRELTTTARPATFTEVPMTPGIPRKSIESL